MKLATKESSNLASTLPKEEPPSSISGWELKSTHFEVATVEEHCCGWERNAPILSLVVINVWKMGKIFISHLLPRAWWNRIYFLPPFQPQWFSINRIPWVGVVRIPEPVFFKVVIVMKSRNNFIHKPINGRLLRLPFPCLTPHLRSWQLLCLQYWLMKIKIIITSDAGRLVLTFHSLQT